MAQIVKLRRSSVSGQKPTNTNLQLGELALNTTDGKVFMAVSGSGGPSVEELISTNTVNTGSINLSGSFNITGSLNLNLTKDPDPNGLQNNTHLFVSSSNTQLGQDLYIRQDGNLVKWKWMEGQLASGLLYGGVVNWSGSNVYISKGSGIIVDYNAVTGSEPSPVVNYVEWNDITGSITNIATSQVTYLLIDSDGDLQQQDTLFTPQQFQESIPLGAVGHFDNTNIQAFGGDVNTAYGQQTQTNAFIDAFGPMKLSGYILEGQTGTLSLNVGSGTSFIHGGFYDENPNNPSTYTSNAAVTASIVRCHTANGETIFDTNNNNFYTTVDPTKWDDGNVLATVGSGNWTIQRVFTYPQTNTLYIYYGQKRYTTLLNALQYLATDPFIEGIATQPFTTFVGYLVLKGNASDLTDTDFNTIIQGGLYRGTVGGSTGGSAVVANIEDLNDVTITSAVTGQALIYDAGIWVNGTPKNSLSSSYVEVLNQDVIISGSLNLTGSIVSQTTPLVSSSSQIDITGTTGYSTFSSSLSSSIGELSSSVAITTNDLDGRVDSLETESGSIRTEFNSYTSSTDGRLFAIETESGSIRSEFNSYTSSTDDRLTSIETESGSIRTEFNLYTSSADNRLLSLESESGSIRSNFNSFTSSYNTGSFTGSFIGDGSGLYNIPASGVTGLQLDKIINGNASASIDDTGLYVNRDLYVAGTITAEEIHTTYVTSSVLYQSGSTKFGDTSDDTHQITGSLLVSGSITTEDLFVNGDIQLGLGDPYDRIIINAQFSSSLYPDSDGDHAIGAPLRRWKFFGSTGSFNHIHGVSGSTVTIESAVITGSMSGSFTGDASGLINVPFVITGSDVDGVNYDKQFSKLHFDSDTGLNVSESAPGTAFISIGSHFRDIFVSGSDMLRATGSDAFEITSEGGVTITTSIIDTNSNGYVKELHFSTTELSSSFNDRIENITGSINNLTSSFNDLTNSFNSLTSSFNTYTSSIDSFTSSVVLTSETSSMTVLSASYAMTAAFALNAGGGGEGKTAQLNQTTPSTTWTFSHFLGEQYPTVTIYDNNDNVVIPTTITAIDVNTIEITFPSNQTGHAVATVGGGLPYISGSFNEYVLTAVGSTPTWKGGMVSGSLQITNFGFTTTGSNTFIGDQVIQGSLTIREAQFKQFTITGITVGSHTVTGIANGLYDAAFYDYVVKDGTNMRAGTVTAVWDGSTVKYNEVSTTDIGDTSAVNLSVVLASGNAELIATISSGTWDFKTLIRGI